MTISPPSKVDHYISKPLSVLASGVDSLVLTIDVTWEDDSFFEYLTSMKDIAKELDGTVPVILGKNHLDEPLLFLLQPFGTKGYEWILNGKDFSLRIGNWLEPQSRPSIIAEIRSEALWALGPLLSVEILFALLHDAKATFEQVKASRIDLCVDLLLSEKTWDINLNKYLSTRATYRAAHFHNSTLTGISIGKGKLAARLYDKPLEITQKSKKFWMYGIWGIDSVPENLRLIRVEAQFRREGIKELGLDTVSDFFLHPENLWAYFAENWLKFQTNPGKHHTQRKTLPFWKTVQKGFLGVQDAIPLIRCKSIQTKKKQQFAQTAGALTSLIAIDHEEQGYSLDHETTIDDTLATFKEYSQVSGKNDFELNIDILTKRAKHHKAKKKMLDVHKQRTDHGLPCNLPIDSLKLEGQEKWKNFLQQKN